MSAAGRPMRVMLMLSTVDFERFFGGVLGLDRAAYLNGYRNDFSWQYSRLLLDAGLQPIIAVRSVGPPAQFRTEEGIEVCFLRTSKLWRLWRKRTIANDIPASMAVPADLPADSPAQSPAGGPGPLKTTVVKLLALVRRLLGGLPGYVAESVAVVGSLNSVRAARPDVIYVQEYWTAQFDIVALTSRIPVVAGDHGGDGAHAVKIFKRRALNRARWVTAQTLDEANLVRRYGARVSLLPNPVETDFYAPAAAGGWTEDRRTILVVARLTDEQKRISDVIRALVNLPGWTLDLVGTGPDQAVLEALADELNVRDRVSFVGFVSDRAALRRRYTECGVAVMASAHEARTLAVMEAMACGCAVVVSDIPPFADLAKDCGDVFLRFPMGDVNALSSAIAAAYEDRARLGKLAREAAVTKLSADVFGRTLAAMLTEAAGKAER
jgi:glycosyltransferase involved in cell wall biosynthesis